MRKETTNSEIEKLVVPQEFKGIFGSVRLPANLKEKEEIRKKLKTKHGKRH